MRGYTRVHDVWLRFKLMKTSCTDNMTVCKNHLSGKLPGERERKKKKQINAVSVFLYCFTAHCVVTKKPQMTFEFFSIFI